ncbi:MAG: DUF885 domain-containing protein [Gammaproteobacteria bacterium HGW-Gammaproteobacteria-8]|nr:MAG: DUF885 domain-containing protein [Gammaproteobacteria bacterium HGW-Gammaproteobacteria-8]
MIRRAGRVLWFGLVLLAAAPLAAQDADAGKAFAELVADYEVWRLAENPIRAGREGDLEAAARWPDPSAEAVARRNAAEREFLKRLRAIDPAALNTTDATSYAVLSYLLETATALMPFAPERMPFVNDSGFFSMPLSLAASIRPRNFEQAEAWLTRLERLPDYLAGHRAWMEKGVAEGFVQPVDVVEAVLGQLEAIVASSLEDSPLLAPLDALPAQLDADRRTALRQRAVSLVVDTVMPAYRELIAFFRETYLAEPRTSIGISEVPGGRDYYRVLVRQHTTLDTTPEEVHQRGLSEVARIRAEMEQVIAETGFDGSFAEFLQFMRSDPQFYARTPRELLMHASWIAKRADDQMPRYFGRLPRLPYGVRPVPDHMAPTYTTGRYWPGDLENGVAGGYMVNTWSLDQRPLYTLPALTLHEAVPGHHHQNALAQELEGVPDFRQQTYITAFGEGWGLYTEFLGIEMGIYTTPYEHFGRLTYEMWRACRLVVDTGIHYFGWSREQAEACLLENSALAPHNVRTEVARYISWPGQALAYKTGELLIRDLRKRAESELGDRFDLRAFHDHLLADGAMPLEALERKMSEWIAAQREQG